MAMNPWMQIQQQQAMALPRQQIEMASAADYPGLSDALTSRIPFDRRGALNKPNLKPAQNPFAKKAQEKQQQPQQNMWQQMRPQQQMMPRQQQMMGPQQQQNPYMQMPTFGKTY